MLRPLTQTNSFSGVSRAEAWLGWTEGTRGKEMTSTDNPVRGFCCKEKQRRRGWSSWEQGEVKREFIVSGSLFWFLRWEILGSCISNVASASTWEPVGNTDAQAPSQTYRIRICVSMRPQADLCAHASLRGTVVAGGFSHCDAGPTCGSCYVWFVCGLLRVWLTVWVRPHHQLYWFRPCLRSPLITCLGVVLHRCLKAYSHFLYL